MGRIVTALLLTACLATVAYAAEAKTCVVCKMVFTNHADYIKHIRTHLGAKQPVETTGSSTVAKTRRGRAKTSTPIVKLTYRGRIKVPTLHSAISAGSRMPVRSRIPSFSCPYCGKQVVSHLGMLLHLQWHKGGQARKAPAVETAQPSEEEPSDEEDVPGEETSDEEAAPAEEDPPATEPTAKKAPVEEAPAKKADAEDDVLSVLDE